MIPHSVMVLLPYSIIGFVAFEFSVRFLDRGVDGIRAIGWPRYLIYILVFGIFSVLLSASFASIALEFGSFSIFLSLIGGYSVPAGGRLALLSLAKSYFGLVSRTGFGQALEVPPNPLEVPKAPGDTDQTGLEETWTLPNRDTDLARPRRRSFVEALMGASLY